MTFPWTAEEVVKKYLAEAAHYVTLDTEADEVLLRGVEEIAEVPEQGADDFRRKMLMRVGVLAHRGAQTIDYAIELPTLWEAAILYASSQPVDENDARPDVVIT